MIFIGIGSSLGDAAQTFSSATAWLKERGVRVIAQSHSMINPPVGGVAQNQFTNAVWQIEFPETPWERLNWCLLPHQRRWRLKAHKLIRLLQACEAAHGRDRSTRWADRTLDLDLLMFHDLTCARPRLKVPHPEVPKRDFVLRPWQEIVDPSFTIPKFGKLSQLIKKLAPTP